MPPRLRVDFTNFGRGSVKDTIADGHFHFTHLAADNYTTVSAHGAIGTRDSARNAQFTCLQVTTDLMMQSSPTEMWQSLMCTFLQDLRVDAVRIGEGTLWMVTPSLVYIIAKTQDHDVQQGELIILRPTRTFCNGWM